MPRSIKLFGGAKRRFAQTPSRLQKHAEENLGVIMGDKVGQGFMQPFRKPELDTYDAYYEKRQYDDKMDWDEAEKQTEFVSIRDRKPRINYNVAKLVVDKTAAKLAGSRTFPKFSIENSPDDTEFLRLVQKVSEFRAHLLEPIRKALKQGSSFVRFHLVEGEPQIEAYNSKFCYPMFDAQGELDSIDIRYVYEDENDKDASGRFKKKWFGLSLSKMSDVLFDTPEYKQGSKPDFKEISRVDHNLGWVQGEWLRTSKEMFTVDGPSLFGDIMDFIDDLNYSLSQSSRAVAYNQEPQLGVNGMDEDEIDLLIKSSSRAWSLGKEGKAEFIGSDMAGVDAAEQNRDHNRHRMLEVVRVILHDPEKIVGSAQSGKALEVLFEPFVDLIDELRTIFEPQLVALLIKLAMTILIVMQRGEETVIEIPPGYTPTSLDVTTKWPDLFPPTIEDIGKMAAAAVSVAGGNILSREAMAHFLAPFFGVEDVEADLAKVAAQPVINPFGGF